MGISAAINRPEPFAGLQSASACLLAFPSISLVLSNAQEFLNYKANGKLR
jgi:hypothetical protein